MSSYEKERSKRDSRFFQAEQGPTDARCSRCAETAARAEPPRARRETAGDLDEVRTPRLVAARRKKKPAPGRAGFFCVRCLRFCLDVDAGFCELSQKVIRPAFLVERLL